MGDFNFDSTEDLAIRSEDGMAGTYYRFYVQGKDHWFRLDPFLTDSMQIVPTYPFGEPPSDLIEFGNNFAVHQNWLYV